MKILFALVKAAAAFLVIVMCLAILALMYQYFGQTAFYTTVAIMLFILFAIVFYDKK